MAEQRFGANQSDWDHFDFILGLGQDVLPVVSNPNAVISPDSAMKSLGKTPSRYNQQRLVAGIKDWTSHVSTPGEIARWSREPDYGICLQTRSVRAIDVDIEDSDSAKEVFDELEHLGLPVRQRDNSSKFLLAFTLPGDMPKRVIKTAHGIIEFLATGQQFIAIGTHPSGCVYEWVGGLPYDIPALTLEQFEAVWKMLEEKFAVEPSTTAKASTKAVVLAESAVNDATAQALYEQGLVIGTEKDGRLHITCPFADEHSQGESALSATTYWPANTGGYRVGNFRCLHAHCDGRTNWDFLNALGIVEDLAADFEAVLETDATGTSTLTTGGSKYTLVPAMDFSEGKPLEWVVKGVVPRGEVVLVYGESGAGKSFWVLDLVAAVTTGTDWCERRTKQGRVCYVAAEGAGGFKKRIKAYCQKHAVNLTDLMVLSGAPNLLSKEDVLALGNAMRASGAFDLLIIDTLAQTTAGANENSGEDMGLALANCRVLHQVTGATVVIIHHSGKDASKGARGWSGIKGALDAEIAITRCDEHRTATVTKMKDGEDGAQFGFKLEVVPIGEDEDGDPISSCVVTHGDVVSPKKKEKALGDLEKLVRTAVLETCHPDGTPATADEVLEYAKNLMPSPLPGVRDQRLGGAKRALTALLAKGLCVSMNGGIKIATDTGEQNV